MKGNNKSLSKIGFTGLSWTTSSTVLIALIQIVQISFLARYMEKEEFGLIAMSMVVIQFSNVFVSMGLSSALLHIQNVTKREYSSLYWFNIILATVFYGIIFLITPLIASYYEESQLNDIIPVLSLNIIFLTVGRLHKTMLEKQFYFKTNSIIDFTASSSGFIVCLIFIELDYGIFSLIFSTLLTSIINSFLTLLISVRKFGLGFVFHFKSLKKFLKVGGFNMGGSIFDFLSREFDIIIIGKVLGMEILGVYNLSKLIVVKIYAIINPLILRVFTPLLASIQNDSEKLRDRYLKLIGYLSFLNAPLYLFIIIFSDKILIIMYGADYGQQNFILICLAVAYFINTLSSPVSTLQIATGRTDLGFYWTIFRIIITVITLTTGAYFGKTALGICLILLSLFFVFPLWWYQIRKMILVSFKKYVRAFASKGIIFITTCALFTVFWFLQSKNVDKFLILMTQVVMFLLSLFFLYVSSKKLLFELLYKIFPNKK